MTARRCRRSREGGYVAAELAQRHVEAVRITEHIAADDDVVAALQ